MRIIYILLIFLIFQNCSFDNKSGIWKDVRSPAEKKGENKIFKEFKTLSISENIFNEEILLDKNYYFTVSEPKRNIEWIDVFYKYNNNYENFKYKGLNKKFIRVEN